MNTRLSHDRAAQILFPSLPVRPLDGYHHRRALGRQMGSLWARLRNSGLLWLLCAMPGQIGPGIDARVLQNQCDSLVFQYVLRTDMASVRVLVAAAPGRADELGSIRVSRPLSVPRAWPATMS